MGQWAVPRSAERNKLQRIYPTGPETGDGEKLDCAVCKGKPSAGVRFVHCGAEAQRSTTDMCAAVARSSHSHGMIRVISECTTTHVDPINVRTALHSTTTVKTELIHRAPRAEPPTKASLSKPVQITIGPIGHAPRTLCALAARPTVGSVGEHPMCSPAAGRHPHPSPRLVRVKRTRSHTIAYEYDRPAPLPSRAPTHRPPTANG